MPQKTSSLLSAPGSNFGLGRVQPTSQPTRQQGLAILGLLADLSPAGDVMAMGSGLANRDALEFGLGAASLLLPGTIKPELTETLYHGTNKLFKDFKDGVNWFGSSDVANAFAGGGRRGGMRAKGAQIIPAKLKGKIAKPNISAQDRLNAAQTDEFIKKLGVEDIDKFKADVLAKNAEKAKEVGNIPADQLGISTTIPSNAELVSDLDMPRHVFSYFDNQPFVEELQKRGIDGVELIHQGVDQVFDKAGRIIKTTPTTGKAIGIFSKDNIVR